MVCRASGTALKGYSLTAMPVFDQKRPALVVPPATADFEISPGIPLLLETNPLHQRDRRGVVRLNIGFNSMEPNARERLTHRLAERFRHVALSRIRLPQEIAEVSASKRAQHDL